jgi:predicted nucleotidyltransferase
LPPFDGATLGRVVTDERCTEYAEACDAVVKWASGRPDIQGVAVVGSWARSEPRMDCDIDLAILTTQKAATQSAKSGLRWRSRSQRNSSEGA